MNASSKASPRRSSDVVEAEVEVLPPDGEQRERGPRVSPHAGVPPTGSSTTTTVPHGWEPMLRAIAFLLDDLFRVPGTKWRFGLDPIIGLIPGFGGAATGLMSCLTMVEAARRGLPKVVLTRMALNILVNSVADSIPVAGDAFSAFFKSNRINYELLKKYTAERAEKTIDPATGRPRQLTTHRDWLFVMLLVLGLLVTVGLLVGIGAWISIRVLGFLFGSHPSPTW